MRYVVVTSILLALSSGCSRKPEVARETPTPQTATPEVRMVEPVSNISLPPATANKTSAGTSIAERVNRQPRTDSNPSTGPAQLQFAPAGENSEIAVTMDADGAVREIRVFRDHPQLMRVESSFKDPRERSLKFTMRNGKVVNTRTSRLSDLRAATAADLLAIAGR